nr:probable inactive serine/threonine-protein kinase bub1 [Ipomoea batatas]
MSGGDTLYNNLFSSVISDIKSYAGRDPLLPWLRGIRKMKESLPPQALKEKLPRFLQKCAQTFETDRRYSNDLRYLRVWLQLMDYVDDPKAVLRSMEMNRIGMKSALFYQAYALYYEKMKKFEAAEKMYHLGVQNLAEPLDELHKSYDQFINRLEKHKNKKIQRQERKSMNRLPCTISVPLNDKGTKENNESLLTTENTPKIGHDLQVKEVNHHNLGLNPRSMGGFAGPSTDNGALDDFSRKLCVKESNDHRKFSGEDTIVVKKFVGNAIVGKSDFEDARHHGLVEPTINTKEAINAINSMFREPLEPSFAGKKSTRSQPKVDPVSNNGFEIYVDEKTVDGVQPSDQILTSGASTSGTARIGTQQPLQEPFQIYVDEDEYNDESNDAMEGVCSDRSNHNKLQHFTGSTSIPNEVVKGFVFPRPSDAVSEPLKDHDTERPPQERLRREDTVVIRFVGSTISDDLEVENACHHGLVDPTINLKEAMADINSMFGKPIEFTRKSRAKKQNTANKMEGDTAGFMILPDDDVDHSQEKKSQLSSSLRDNQPKNQFLPTKIEGDSGGFLILPDDEIDHPQEKKSQLSSTLRRENDLFEKTVCTKEAMDEINKMFSMPLDF